MSNSFAKAAKADFNFKFVMIGDTGSGKSCILLRFADDTYTETYITTIGVDFRFRTVTVEGKTCKLQIWDTAGQERYRTITSAYYRGADAIVMVYDITSMDSFKHVNDWLLEVKRYTKEDTLNLLIGNKCDMEAERQVSKQQGEKFATDLNVPFLETSAKDGTNVDPAFLMLTKKLMERDSNKKNDVSNGGVKIGRNGETKAASNCC